MMHRCSSSSQGHVMGRCTCGMFHTQTNSSFSMLFSMPKPYDHDHSSDIMYSSSSSSSVDCTLSLGTPSTRFTEDEEKRNRHHHHHRSSVPNFCWDLLQSSKHTPQSHTKPSHSNNTARANNNHSSADPLLARRCANCDTTSTPLWRNGPRGPKSLCNACGIRFKKEERRASAVAATTTAGSSGGVMESPAQMYSHHHHHTSWYGGHSQSQKIPCLSPAAMGGEFRFVDNVVADRGGADNAIPFLSWRLNVTDRPSLVHDFTR